MRDLDAFRALCKRVTDEKDPAKLERLRERMTILLANQEEDDSEIADPVVH